ncbi:MAG: DUF1523 family protein [Litoreibacter sp.]
MHYIKYVLWIVFWAVVFTFLHYTLPQRDIVRVVETEVRRVDFGENSWFWAGADSGQDTDGINRDVRFVNTVLYGGGVMVYRNEDTGWGWPPYFKLDSSNLQTEAADLASSNEEPKWVVITHYGWRNAFFSIFPNAVGVRIIDDPEKTLIPYFNILILVILAGLMLGLYRLTQWVKRNSVDPIVEDMGEAWGAVDGYADEKRGRFRAWLDTWRGKPRM